MSDPSMPPGRAARRARIFRVLPWAGFAGVGLALAAGVSFARLRVLVVNLAVSGVAVLAGIAIERGKRRRASRQRRAELPRGVRLTGPLWLKADLSAIVLTIGGTVAAVPAAFGLSAVSVGVLLTFVVMGVGTPLLAAADGPLALTFEDQGLRTDYRKGPDVIAWDTIRAVRLEGPDHFRYLFLDIADREPLMMMPWTAGLDAAALARAIESARTGAAPALN